MKTRKSKEKEDILTYTILNDVEYKEIEDKQPYNAINFRDYFENKQVFINPNKDSLSFSQYHDKEYLDKETLNILKKIFDLKCNNLKDKFVEATSGSGGELKKICTLKSSSLCAFLHFSMVSSQKPIVIHNVEYEEIHFEVQNRVFSKGTPSNVDILLISKDKNNIPKNILFLESKFSEYLYNQDKSVSPQYKSVYDLIEKHNTSYSYENIKKKKYYPELQQFIAHFIGVYKFINTEFEESKKLKRKLKIPDDCHVKLGEIVFDGWKNLNDYKKEYSGLADVLNEVKKEVIKNGKQENLEIVDNLLTYQEIFRDDTDNIKLINKKIRKFYKYD